MYIYEGNTKEEVEAYRKLQSESFTFGQNIVVNEGLGEDVYYKMHLALLDELEKESTIKKEIDFHKKNRKRAIRRKKNWSKAIRRKKLSWFPHTVPLNYYNKNKNFCSCSMCTEKTNPIGKNTISSSNGTKIKYSSRNWKHSDQQRIDNCQQKEMEYDEKDICSNNIESF